MYHVRGIDTVAPWKRCCSFNVFIYIYIHICIYIYIHAYINKLCVKDNGKSTTIRRRELKCGRSWNDIVGLCCSSFCLNQGQCCSHFVSPLFSPSILLLYCECFLCSLQAVSRDFWPMCSANCMRAVGWGWAGFRRGCDDV